MAGRTNSAAHTKAVAQVQQGMRQLTRGLRLMAKGIVREAESAARGRRRTASPGRRIHGQYIGLIRNMPARDKAKVRAVHAEQGVEAAIKVAREMRRAG